ncbi:hypothetical protein BHE74_00007087, partial [Ensete ventricosum]
SMSSNANAKEAVMPRSVPVTLAHEFLTAGHRYLDVRLGLFLFVFVPMMILTVKEFSGGHAVGAVNIPYMLESVSECMSFAMWEFRSILLMLLELNFLSDLYPSSVDILFSFLTGLFKRKTVTNGCMRAFNCCK